MGTRLRVWFTTLFAAALAAMSVSPSGAQEVTALIQFTNVWKYDQSGRDLRTAWRTNDYDDSAWPSGPGLLGFEDGIPYPYPLAVATPLTISTTVTTYYFRATFEFSGLTNNLRLMATGYVDDGCAIYLNGVPVGAVRAPATFDAATYFPGLQTDGQVEVVSFTNHLGALRQGLNTLAVEVHQSFVGSSDVMFGMDLMAIRDLPTPPLTIVSQPQSQKKVVGEAVTFRVDISGGPASYRWQKDGVNLSSTSNSLVIALAQLANSGDYRVICSNTLTVVTSSVATLTVLADLIGPTALRALENNGFGPDSIHVVFSDVMNPTSVRNIANYSLTQVGTSTTVGISNILYSQAIGLLIRLDNSDPDWRPDADYVLTINNVTDTRGNAIVPNTEVPLARQWNTNIIEASTVWSGHARYSADLTIYQQPWSTPDYVEDPQFWITGRGPFCGGAIPEPPCEVDCETQIDYQLSPTLFRTTFVWPEELDSTGRLVVSGSVDDGLALFLNGVEIWRTNALGTASPITVTNYASVAVSGAACLTQVSIPVTGLVPGVNCLAAAVLQPRIAAVFDTAFSLTAEMQAFRAPAVPPSGPAVTLRVESLPNNAARISWEGNGYALEYVTNMTENVASYPAGPWIQAPGMSNPYTNRPPSPARFFRLKR